MGTIASIDKTGDILAPLAAKMRDWLMRDALPFWAEHSPDRLYGGFIEDLNFDGSDAAQPFKRTRVTCRQIYAFAHASALGWDDGDALIHDGADYLIAKAWRDDERGFARRLTRGGDVLDPDTDLYDTAFALFAFAWAYKATKDAAYKDWCDRTHKFVVERMAHPSGRGFRHILPMNGWRAQNPHMHFLEACLAAYGATSDSRYADSARDLVALFNDALFDRETGVLTEFFNDDMTPAPPPDGDKVEPGHQYEWAWILRFFSDALGNGATEDMMRLIDVAEEFGLDGRGAIRNAVTRTGAVIDGGSRSWPNTERVKAGVAIWDIDQPRAAAMIEGSSRLLFDVYLSSHPNQSIPPGAWIDAFDANGAPTATAVPTSIFYHMFLAFAEVIRLADPERSAPLAR